MLHHYLRHAIFSVGVVLAIGAEAQEETWTPLGTGSEELPYQISSIDDFIYFANKIEKIENYSKDKFFVLLSDISFQDEIIIDEDGILVADTTKLAKWNPIGTEWYGKSFAGTFDGQGHTISGLYVDAHSNKYQGYAGLFGHMSGTVKNLTIKNSYFAGGSAIGAIAGEMRGEDAVIENCINYGTVSGEKASTMQIGGIFGYTYYGSVKNCINYGRIELSPEADEWEGMWNCSAGGIGGSGGSINGCENRGHIIANGWGGLGGIVGSPRYVSGCINYGTVEDFYGNSIGGINGWSGSIWNCENHGRVISHSSGAKIGGIGGQISGGGRIGDCINFTDISSSESNVHIGGICGYGDIDGYTTTYITDCQNMGNVSTDDPSSRCAGIVPYLYHATARHCKNYGDVKSASEAGGIAALAMAHSTIWNSENYGHVTGKGYVGGIAGQGVEGAHGCVNFGDITLIAGSRVGGILGYMSSSSSSVIDCANLGKITTLSNSMIGGIAGNSSSYGTIRCCYNSGDIVSYGDSWIGGIAGYMANGIYDCYNKGNVINFGDGSCVAGIAGWSNSSIINAFATGYIYCLGENETAGNVVSGTYSSFDGFARKTNIYYSNKIIGEPAKYTNASPYWKFTEIEESEIATLTEVFNQDREWGDNSGWMDGYFHPVLKRYYATADSDYDDLELNFKVAKIDGDSCRIDLGIPFDNTFFTTDAEGLPTMCCNTEKNDSINRMWVVDHKDFLMPKSYNVKNACMRVNDVQGFSAKVFPWTINADELTEGIKTYRYAASNEDGKVHFTPEESFKTGEAVLVELPDTLRYFSIRRSNFAISQPDSQSGTFAGSFVNSESPLNAYVLNAQASNFEKLVEQTEVKAFDAYLTLDDCTQDVLDIVFDSINGVKAVSLGDAVLSVRTAGDLKIEIVGNTELEGVDVYDLKGHIVYSAKAAGKQVCIAFPTSGIYIVKIGNKTIKIRV